MEIYKLAHNMVMSDKALKSWYIDNVETKERFEIQGAGGYVLELMDGETTVDFIVDKLCEAFGAVAEREVIEKDVRTLVSSLESAEIIVRVK